MSAFALLVGALVLLIVSNVRVERVNRASATWIVSAFLVVGLGTAFALKHGLSKAGWVPTSELSRLIKYAAPRLEAALDEPSTRLVVLLNGSSLSHRGVNGRRLEAALSRDLGVSVAVVQLSIPGSNHLERDKLLRRLNDALSPESHRKLAAIPLVVLWEVHQGYDSDPLAQFERNQGTSRALDYLDVENGLFLASVMVAAPPEPREEALKWIPEVLKHVAISAAGVSAKSWQAPSSNIRELEGFVPARLRVVPKFSGLSENVDRLRRQPKQAIPTYIDEHLIPRYLGRLSSRKKTIVFYSPPTRVVWQMAYVKRFCEKHGSSVCIGFVNRELLNALDDPRYWFDGSHLSMEGALVYTDWLAQVLSTAIARHGMATMPD